MKNKLVVFSSALAIACLAQAATANEGKIKFFGGVSDTTCKVSVNGQVSYARVQLPIVSSRLLQNRGDTAGRTFLDFELSGCSSAGELASKATVFFTAGDTITPNGRLENTLKKNHARNVQLQILNKDAEIMNLAKGVGNQRGEQVNITTNATGQSVASIRHFVEYYAQGQATVGGLESSVEFEIDYQ